MDITLVNDNGVKQINAALLSIDDNIKKLKKVINSIDTSGGGEGGGITPGETYDINISGTASHATTADSATTADTANTANNAGHALTADSATNADHATTADNATNADYATTAGTATYAETSGGAPPVFPEGYVYMQLYNPSTSTWEKTPAQMGLQIPSGYKWTEITANFSSYPYLKIGTGTTQSGHNAYHRHTHNHTHSHSHTAYTGCYTTSNEASGYGLGGQPGFANRVMVSAPSNVGTSTDSTGPSSTYTSYDGNSTDQTVEVNASNMKLWKVVVDA